MKPELKLEYLDISKLTPYENNTRRHEDYDISQIAISIQKYEMIDPIGVWGEHNIIVEGHGRYYACKKLGIDKVPVIRLDHLTDEERREYGIIHNKTAELSSTDFIKLEQELEDLDFSDFDIYGLDGNIFDLLEGGGEDLMSVKPADDSQTFNITFSFDKSKRNDIEKKIKDIGKEKITAKIQDMILTIEKE